MTNLKGRLKMVPLPLLFALVVAVGAVVVMVVQINVIPPPPAIVAPVDTQPTEHLSGSQTVTFSVSVYAGQTVTHSNLAALGRVSLEANTTGWYYLTNDWIFAVMRRSTGNATFSLPTGIQVEVFQYNSTHALVVNRQRHTVVIAKIVSVGALGWYAYHPVSTNYDSGTVDGLNRYLSYRGLPEVYVFQPRRDYIEFNPSTKVFRVYFDVVTPTSRTLKGESLTNTTNFTPIQPSSTVIPTDYYIIDINNVVLPPVWVIFRMTPTSSINSALTITPLPPP
jgi:hypothetical protein